MDHKPLSGRKFAYFGEITAVVLSGIFFLYSLNSGLFRSSIKKNIPLPSPETAEESTRTPANIDTKPFSHSQSSIVKLGCIDSETENLDTTADSIRFSAKLCQKNNSPVQEITTIPENQKNAVVSFYDPKEQTLATEFFPLRPGANPVLIAIRWQNGKTWQTKLTIQKK